MSTQVEGSVTQKGELELTSSNFESGSQMPDWVGYANENESPALEITGVTDEIESFVLIMDDPDAEEAVGHVYDHWLVWDIPPSIDEIPRSWQPRPDEGTVGFNDYFEQHWGGPAPPEGSHTYRFKLYGLDNTLQLPPEARKARIGSTIALEAEVVAATQLTGTYHANQGTIF